MAEAMGKDRLARLSADNEPRGDHLSGLTADEVGKLLDEVERLHTWNGLMSQLDRHYPPDVFDGSSGDPGPRIIALTRGIDRLRAQLAEIGETREEWRAEQPSGAWNMSHGMPTEGIARAVVEAERTLGLPTALKRRLAGEWRDVEQEPADA